MSLTEKIIEILEENTQKPQSGQEMADHLKVSRAAVWKSIKVLQNQGYSIVATPNKGYILAADNDVISAAGIRRFLSDKYKDSTIEVLETVNSTNTWAKTRAMAGAAHGSIIVAREQTEGRGRQGRSFFSPKDNGIYLSLILKNENKIEDALFFTIAAALGSCYGMEKLTPQRPQIKWVNDIFIKGKKVCGILTEAISDFESGTLEAVIIGVGLNLNTPQQGFPPELQEIATSIFPEKTSKNNFIGEIASEILRLTDDLDRETLITQYKKRSLVLGKTVTYSKNQKSYQGVAVDIDNNGHLIVKTPQGEDILQSGEISLGSENYIESGKI